MDIGITIIPDSDHVTRYCSPIQAPEGEIEASAFMLRKDEKFLSVNWLEYLKCDSRDKEIAQLHIILTKKLKLNTRGRIAVLNVGNVCNHVRDVTKGKHSLSIRHEEETEDPSHSGIHNLSEDNMFIAESICEIIQERYAIQARTFR